MKKKISAVILVIVLALIGCLHQDLFLHRSISPADSMMDAEAAEQTGQNGKAADGLLDMNALTGFAATDGSGKQTLPGGVTGGNAGELVTVTTDTAFVKAVSDDTPRVVIVSGRVRAISSSGGAINIGSNKTIVGIDKDATLKGGLNISDESNIIISNLTIEGGYGEKNTPDDCINIQGSHHVWLNHLNTHDASDGNIDIKLGSNYITVSWCKIWYKNSKNDHRLSCLVGSGAGDHDDTDYGRLKVTFHHNWFSDFCKERMPRVMYGMGHIYNNYYSCKGNDYCIGVGCYGTVLVENNYFKDVKNPHQFSYADQTYPCAITARGNEYDNTSGKKETGQHPKASSPAASFDQAPYPYLLDDAKTIPDLVQKYAGPQDIDPNATPVPTAEPLPSVEPTAIPTSQPTLKPTATPKPHATDAAPKKVDDSEQGKVWELQGQNSDKTNGEAVVKNPLAGMDLSETPSYSGKYPVWKKGATITYWEYIPSKVSAEGVALSFTGTHRAVKDHDWPLYVEQEPGYEHRFEDNGGTYSLVREGDVHSGLQISTFGSIGFSEDDCVSGWNVNNYSNEYGQQLEFQQKNYYYIFANKSGTTNPLVSKKGAWHFVALVIQNDGIDTYIDGTKTTNSQYNVWGNGTSIDKSGMYVGGQAFNLGYGWKEKYRADHTSDTFSHGILLLDFLTDENTRLSIGGKAGLWETLAMNDFTTPKGIRISDVSGYGQILTTQQIKDLMQGTEPDVPPVPTKSPEPAESETPVPSESEVPAESETPKPGESETPKPGESETPKPGENETPAPAYRVGDPDMDGKITAEDALFVLQAAAKLLQPSDQQRSLADADRDGKLTAEDALQILKYAAKLIDTL